MSSLEDAVRAKRPYKDINNAVGEHAASSSRRAQPSSAPSDILDACSLPFRRCPQAALTQKLDDMLAGNPSNEFRDTLCIVTKEPLQVDDLEDDLKRELAL
jgi:hypothetical protein